MYIIISGTDYPPIYFLLFLYLTKSTYTLSYEIICVCACVCVCVCVCVRLETVKISRIDMVCKKYKLFSEEQMSVTRIIKWEPNNMQRLA